MLRSLCHSDIKQMLVIENAVHVSPWNDETFKACFKASYESWGIEKNNKLIGFVVFSIQAGECHILNICVLHAEQHQGWGRQLLTHALQQAKKAGAGIVYLEVRRSNSRAISMYRNADFHLIGERKGYYQTVAGTEDALIFAKSLVDEDV